VFLEVKEAEANEQNKSIIGALKAAGMRSAQSGDCVRLPASAGRYQTNHRSVTCLKTCHFAACFMSL